MKRSHRQSMPLERGSSHPAFFLVVAAAIVTTAAGIVTADVLYDRTDMTDEETWDTNSSSCITLNNGGWDRQTADDFELDGTYEITSVIGDLSHWSDQPPDVVPADGFLVEFFKETKNCVTGPPPCPAEVPFAAVFAPEFTATLLDVTTPGGGWPIHRFEVDLTGFGIILGPGIWWVSLVAVDESGKPSSLLQWDTFIQVDLPEGVPVHIRAGGKDHGNGYQGGTQPDWRPFPFNGKSFGDAAIRIEGTPVRPPCPADFDNSGDVGVKDLLFLLGTWGPCPKKGDCRADFDDSGDVGVKDLLVLLGNWGPCP